MTPESFIISKASEAIQALYGVEMPEGQLQVNVTRKEFEGDYTLVVFPLLKVSKTTPENTGNAIGEWLKENTAEIAGYNTVKGFLNLSFSNAYWNACSHRSQLQRITDSLLRQAELSWWSTLRQIRTSLSTSDTSVTTFSVGLLLSSLRYAATT